MELLVVIEIIGMLVALLLPAVQSARESSRRSRCANHLKQIGLAVVMHENTRKYFPTGGWDWNSPPAYHSGRPAAGSEQRASWAFQILPYIEAESTWRAGPIEAIKTVQSIYFCPTRRSPQTIVGGDTYDPPLGVNDVERALIDYAGSNRDDDGIIRRYDPLRARQVHDGLSKTMVVAEKRLNLSLLGTPQPDDNEGYASGWNADTMRQTNKSPEPDFYGTGDGEKRFGGSHPAAFNAVFADGSVHSISFDVDRHVFNRVGVVDDGEAYSNSEVFFE